MLRDQVQRLKRKPRRRITLWLTKLSGWEASRPICLTAHLPFRFPTKQKPHFLGHFFRARNGTGDFGMDKITIPLSQSVHGHRYSAGSNAERRPGLLVFAVAG